MLIADIASRSPVSLIWFSEYDCTAILIMTKPGMEPFRICYRESLCHFLKLSGVSPLVDHHGPRPLSYDANIACDSNTQYIRAVEINVTIMCSCMPCYSAFFRRHKAVAQYLKHPRHFPWSFSSFRRLRSGKKIGDRDDDLEMFVSHGARFGNDVYDGNSHALTLGSAVRDGRFLESVDRPDIS